jgi:hypothetical protein
MIWGIEWLLRHGEGEQPFFTESCGECGPDFTRNKRFYLTRAGVGIEEKGASSPPVEQLALAAGQVVKQARLPRLQRALLLAKEIRLRLALSLPELGCFPVRIVRHSSASVHGHRKEQKAGNAHV